MRIGKVLVQTDGKPHGQGLNEQIRHLREEFRLSSQSSLEEAVEKIITMDDVSIRH